MTETTDNTTERGRRASSPLQIPSRGWLDVVARFLRRCLSDQVTFDAAGVAFYGLLALIPGVVAILLVTAMVLDLDSVQTLFESYSAVIPSGLQEILFNQIQQVQDDLQWDVVLLTLALSIYGASRGTRALIYTLNGAYGESESRSFLRLQATVLVFTAVAVVLAVVVVIALIAIPLTIALVGTRLLPLDRAVLLRVLRWPVLWLVTFGVLSLVYRVLPDRTSARWRWIFVGSALASGLWILISWGFSVYSERMAAYGETYGVLGTAVVVVLWLWLSSLVILVGAVLNAELERQTRVDSTVSPDQPMGERGAWAADELGASLGKGD